MRRHPTRVTNAVLRVEGVTGIPPFRWERPNDTLDFWVLELLSRVEPLDEWLVSAIATLKTQKRNLTKFHNLGWKLSMFVETKSDCPVRFEPEILSLLGKFGITLEHIQEWKDCPTKG